MRIVSGTGLGLMVSALLASVALAADGTPMQIGEGKVFPESITSTADGTIIAGSFMLGQIYKAAPGAANATSWIAAPAEGPAAVIGVYADEATKTLWACYSDAAIFSGQPSKPSVLRAYDLEAGTEKGSYPMPESTFCNDIATTADGTAYATDTIGGRLFRLLPGATALEQWFADPQLASLDGLSFGPDGALYLNTVSTNKLFRLDMGADGAAGALTELTLSEEIKGPDGMRFGDDGKLYLAQNGAGRVDAVTIEGDKATITPVASGYDFPTAVSKSGDTLFVGEAKFSQMQAEDPGKFYVYAVPLQ